MNPAYNGLQRRNYISVSSAYSENNRWSRLLAMFLLTARMSGSGQARAGPPKRRTGEGNSFQTPVVERKEGAEEKTEHVGSHGQLQRAPFVKVLSLRFNSYYLSVISS